MRLGSAVPVQRAKVFSSRRARRTDGSSQTRGGPRESALSQTAEVFAAWKKAAGIRAGSRGVLSVCGDGGSIACPSCSRQKGQDSPVGVSGSSDSCCGSNAIRTMPIEVQTSIMSPPGSAVRMAWAARGVRAFNTSTSMANHAVKRRVEQCGNITIIIDSERMQTVCIPRRQKILIRLNASQLKA